MTERPDYAALANELRVALEKLERIVVADAVGQHIGLDILNAISKGHAGARALDHAAQDAAVSTELYKALRAFYDHLDDRFEGDATEAALLDRAKALLAKVDGR